MANSEAQVREALQWETGQSPPEDKSTWVWFWESIQGDFTDERSGGQIAFDAAVSMIPLVDQICDLRDLVANCKAIATAEESEDNTWKYVALALTLIGLFPTLGSALKGVLKISFVFVRRYGLDKLDEALDAALSWIITYLRKPSVQAYLRDKHVDEVFGWLAQQVREFAPKVNTQALLKNYDNALAVLNRQLGKIAAIPVVGERARRTLKMIQDVREKAGIPLAAVDDILQRIFGTLARKVDQQGLLVRHGIINVSNVHFKGTLPETRAVTLMRTTEPPPAWMSKGTKGKWAEQNLKQGKLETSKHPGWPKLNDGNIASFHKMAAVEVKGPAKLYRVVSPTNGAMGDCWIPEDVWKKIMESPDPKTAWRKYLAVWPDWNPNSQFVVLEVPAGRSVKAWRGPASSQVKKEHPDLDAHLEGGWDQLIIKPSGGECDATRIYKLGGGQGNVLHKTDMTYADYQRLPASEKAKYAPVREAIKHPDIKGPYETGWGATDFDAQLNDMRVGLPGLPGQVTN